MLKTQDESPEEDIEATDDVHTDELELEDVEAAGSDKLKQLRNKLKQCEREKMEHLEQLQRVKAEFLNSKRRLEEERERDKERSLNTHVAKLLPLCDSFYMAMSDEDAWEKIDSSWRTGVEGIYNQLQSLLRDYKVETIDPTGHHFDPNVHEAVGTEDTEGVKPDTVVRVMQLGYARNGETIRAAKVILSN